MKIICTSFEPFGNFTYNPTTDLVPMAMEAFQESDVEIIHVPLPVIFDKCADQLKQAIQKEKPEAVISTGLAWGRNGIHVERVGINIQDTGDSEGGRTDNTGRVVTNQAIVENGPDGLFSTLPIHEMVENLRQEAVPAYISNTAGTYICNNTLYRLVYDVKEMGLNIPVGFIHFPAIPEMVKGEDSVPVLALAEQSRALEVIIQTMYSHRSQDKMGG
ncbi:hypothetical protein [Salsuginibacillus kocurii]|uniref:pyroglutamyl-peptidase I family protein n=1 Tax=Salsuginibacillus kocurii TaxID=427078 RepID=UPI000364FDC0|nr:hypothetical protein [Salsuginibacillus kocurii]